MEKARTSNEYEVLPKFSPSLGALATKKDASMKSIDSLRKQYTNELGVEVKIATSTTHTFLFESKKKETDEAFRASKSRRFKQISVKKGCISFTTDEMQAIVAEYNNIKEKYEQEQ